MKFDCWSTGALRGLKVLGLLALFVFSEIAAHAAGPPAGIAPVNPPSGGFAIDGNLGANTPTAGVGDWLTLSAFPGSGGSVFNSAGAPLDPQVTFHFIDAYNGKDIVFSGGQKWDDDPNKWLWTLNKASSKTDINNVLLHITKDVDEHTWVVIAADRYSTSGDSYIDFEFLQNTLVRNSNGTFTSAGPHGGRTLGDIVLSLAFTGGGGVPDFLAYRWQTNGAGGYDYIDITASLPVGRVFAALNTNTIAVPYKAFGQTNYAPNAFAEAALDLTGLLGVFDECLSIGFKTIMVKTKSSPSATATISDLIDPIQYPFRIGPSADAGPDQTRCSEGDFTTFSLHGSATAGTKPIASTAWSVVSGNATIDSPSSLIATVQVFSASAVLRLTAVQTNGCTETDDILLTVSPLPICSITGPTSVCSRASTQFRAPPGMSSYAWSISGNGAISGVSTQQTVTVASSAVCGQEFTLSLNVISNECSSTCATTVMVNDTTAPAIVCPADKVLECPADTRTNVTGIATAQDNCGVASISYTDSVVNNCGGAKVISRTWTATDFCGNANSCVQTITVRDTIKPTILCPANKTVECGADTSTNAAGIATAQDTCGAVTIIYADAVSNKCGGTKIISRTWTATDDCGNSSSCVQTITVVDTTKPTIQCPPAVVLECGADTTTNSTGVATAQDVCGQVSIRYTDSVTNKCGLTKVISRTWTATDDCGNSSSCVQTITVVDTTKPTIHCPPNQVLECGASTTTNATGVATAEDVCGSVTIRYTDAVSNKCGGTKIISRTWTANDQCGNTNTCVQTITVQDTTAPSIQCPADKVVECGGSTATNVTGIATAQDTCGSVVVRYSDVVSNKCGLTKVILRTWTATDDCGNVGSCLQTITVVDTTKPTIQCPANKTVECGGDTRTNATGVATAQDVCGQVTITYSDSVSNNCAGTKVISRTWTAIDQCGNSSGCVQMITVVDTTAPTIQCPANRVVECGSSTATNDMGVATAQDICGQVTITYSDSVSNKCGLTKVISRTWTAIDDCGNRSSCVQTITVQDTTKPTIQCPPDRVLDCPANTTTNFTGMATAQDVCGSVTITYSDSVTNKCTGTKVITRTWTATDQCGNSSSCVQTITVQDITRPVLTIPSDKVLECPADTRTNVTGIATATDTCSPATVRYSDVVTAKCGGTKIIARTWTATDECGNTTSAVQTITVEDTTPPTITCPADQTLPCPADTRTNVTGVATGSDVCGGVAITFADSVQNNCAGAKVIRRTWTATDDCGNRSTCVQTITVIDTVRPTISVPPDQTLECGASTAPSATGTATGQDGCSQVTISYSDSVVSGCGGSRVITRTWTASDGCGNSTNKVQVLTVRDTTPPAMTLPSNRVLQCPGDIRTTVTGVPTVNDVCGSYTVTYSDIVSNSCGSTKTIWRTWTAVDACGNTTNGTQTIAVVDTTKPSITCPSISVQCVDDLPPVYPDLTTFLAAGGKATDSCSPTLSFALMSDSGIVGRCPGRVTRVYRVTDVCGNFGECTQTITVDDTIAPVLTCPTNMIVECGPSLDPLYTGWAKAIDNCSTNVSLTYTDRFMSSEYSVNFYAADPDLGTGPYSPTYIRLGPASLPRPVGRALDPLRNAVAYAPNGQLDALTSLGGEPMALGQVIPFEAVIELTGGPGPERGTIEFTVDWSTYTTSNDRFGYDKNYMVYCAFVDAADPGCIDPKYNAKVDSFSSKLVNSGTIDEQIEGTFRVSGLDIGDRVVVEIWLVFDSQMPDHVGGTIAAQLVSAQKVLTPPEPISIGSKTISIGNLGKCGPLPPAQTQPPLGPLPPQPPVLPGITVSVIDRTWTATDDCGNRSTCAQRFTVRDTMGPAINAPDMMLECPADTSTNATGVAVAIDACGGPVVLTYTDSVTTGCGATKVVARTWTAIDQNNNTNSVVQTIIVHDTTPPAVMCPPDAVVECLSDTSTNVMGVATAQDLCGSVTIRYSDAVTAGCGGSKIIVRTWTATDNCGNATNVVQTITVRDTTPPAIVCPANRLLGCPADTSPAATGMATAQDLCSSVAVSYSDSVTPGCGNSKVIARTWIAIDDCGNTAQCVQTITVRDTTPPIITCPANKVLDCPANTSTNATGVATAVDTCGSVTVRYSDAVTAGCGNTKVIARTWIATDDCGNTAQCVQTITVRDITAPTITCPANKVLDCPANTSTNATGVATAVDTCGSVTVRYSDAVTAGCGNTKVIARTWIATDDCGNTAQCVQTITVRDTTAPTISCQPDRSVNFGDAWNFDQPVASDTCGTASIRILSTSTNFTTQTTCAATRTWEAYDDCGNASTCQQTITILNAVAPTLNIRCIDPTHVELSWVAPSSGFQLEVCDAPGSGTWSAVQVTPTVINGMNVVVLPSSSPQKFYRLHKVP